MDKNKFLYCYFNYILFLFQDIEHSPSSRHESVVLPPVRQGTYPNFVSLEVDPDVDLAAELEREHKKLKEERARKEKQEKEGKIKKEHSRKEKGNPIPNKAEDTTDVPDTRQSVTRKLRRSMSFPPAKPASDGRSSRNEDLMSVDVSHDEISSGDTQEPNYAEKELSIAAKGDTQEPNYAEKELSITAKGILDCTVLVFNPKSIGLFAPSTGRVESFSADSLYYVPQTMVI